jgi:hypothetical protein
LDLAATLGTSADELARTLTETELSDWQAYAHRRMLPQRRLELYLAQIAMLIAKTMGGAQNVRLTDFMFDPAGPDIADEMTAEEEAEAFGFRPVTTAAED